MKPDLIYLIALKAIPGIGDVIARRLIASVADASDLFVSSDEKIKRLSGIPPKAIASLLANRTASLQKASDEMAFIDKHGITCFSYYEDDYPARLKHCFDAPLFLFFKGSGSLEQERMLAIVGTRKSTVYGRSVTARIVSDLAQPGISIVSGLAHGIDTAAHQAALDAHVPTIGVMAHGFRFLYPEENKKMASQMLECGGLVTEFLSTEQPDKVNFPIRNRIIAGLSDAILVVEAQSKGGALITAEMANSYSREVFTIPGRIDDQKSRGCNWLIRTNRAHLVESAEQLRTMMNWDIPVQGDARQTRLDVLLDEDARQLYDFLFEHGESQIDMICNGLNISLHKAAHVLLQLELTGILHSLPGKRYVLKHI